MNVLLIGDNGCLDKNLYEWLEVNDVYVDHWIAEPNVIPAVRAYQWVINCHEYIGDDIDCCLRNNYEYNQILFSQCQEHEVNFQYLSTPKVYMHPYYMEHLGCHPNTPYSWSKYLFDRWVFDQPISKTIVQGFRHFNIFGRFQKNIIAEWQQQARNTGELVIPVEYKKIFMDWVWVGDVCDIHVEFLKNVRGSGIWNIGSGKSISHFELAEKVAAAELVDLKYDEAQTGITLEQRQRADLSKIKSASNKRVYRSVLEWI